MATAARATKSNKPDGEALKAMMRGALENPDSAGRGPALSLVPQGEPQAGPVEPGRDPRAFAPEPVPAAPQADAHQPASPQPPAEPPRAETAQAAAPGTDATVVAEQPAAAPRAPASDPTPEPMTVEDIPQEASSARAEPVAQSVEAERPRVGRKRNPDPLRNITLSMREDHCDRLMELSAYERLRLKRAVDMSELVRHILDIGLAQIVDNKVLPEQGRAGS